MHMIHCPKLVWLRPDGLIRGSSSRFYWDRLQEDAAPPASSCPTLSNLSPSKRHILAESGTDRMSQSMGERR